MGRRSSRTALLVDQARERRRRNRRHLAALPRSDRARWPVDGHRSAGDEAADDLHRSRWARSGRGRCRRPGRRVLARRRARCARSSSSGAALPRRRRDRHRAHRPAPGREAPRGVVLGRRRELADSLSAASSGQLCRGSTRRGSTRGSPSWRISSDARRTRESALRWRPRTGYGQASWRLRPRELDDQLCCTNDTDAALLRAARGGFRPALHAAEPRHASPTCRAAPKPRPRRLGRGPARRSERARRRLRSGPGGGGGDRGWRHELYGRGFLAAHAQRSPARASPASSPCNSSRQTS